MFSSVKRFIVAACLILILFVACYQAPITQRSQVILISEAQEVSMGLTAFQQVLGKADISDDPFLNEAVRRVGTRIARVSERPNYNWEFKVIDAPDTVNAFALPGGKMAVYTGIIPIAENEAGLATVMSHEIGHVIARHGGERISMGILAELGAVGLNVALKNKDPDTIRTVNMAYGLGTTLGIILPFSRTQESEADRIGLVYMAKAGYDPREALYFWERMESEKINRLRPPEFLSTHQAMELGLSRLRLGSLRLWSIMQPHRKRQTECSLRLGPIWIHSTIQPRIDTNRHE